MLLCTVCMCACVHVCVCVCVCIVGVRVRKCVSNAGGWSKRTCFTTSYATNPNWPVDSVRYWCPAREQSFSCSQKEPLVTSQLFARPCMCNSHAMQTVKKEIEEATCIITTMFLYLLFYLFMYISVFIPKAQTRIYVLYM